MGKYRYFVAFSYRDDDGKLCHGNMSVERDEPIRCYEGIEAIESDMNRRAPFSWSGVTVLNFCLFDEAPARPGTGEPGE